MSPRYRLSPILRAMCACTESLAWLEREQHASFRDAITACPRHGWLVWLVGRTCDRRQIVSLACDLAEPSLRHVTDPRQAACVATVRAWLRGDATLDDVRASRQAAAAGAAWAAASAATSYDDGGAAAAAGGAAYAAAAAYASYAAAHADAYAARSSSLAKSRDIIRAAIDWSAVERRLVEIGHARGALVECAS